MAIGKAGARGGTGSLGVLGTARNWWAPLFANGESGFIFPGFSNLAYLFQDSAGTTPVTTTGDSVGLAKDRSGTATNASESTTTMRPTWQANSGKPYLAFDGVDDYLQTTLLPTTAMTMAVAFRSANANTNPMGGGNSGASLRASIAIGATGQLGAGWGAQNNTVITGGSDIRGVDHVGILVADASNVSLYLDGVSIYSAAPSGSPAGSTSGIAVGANNNNAAATGFTSGNIYASMAMNRRATVAEIATINSNFRSTYP
jgi:hypothetical protein